MAFEIPLQVDVPNYSEQVTLEGVVYTFEFRWNAREASWYMSLLTAEEDPIVYGVKVVIDTPLAYFVVDERLPPGKLVAQDTSGSGVEPGLHDLGGRVVLVYFTPAEVAAAAGA